MYAAMLVLLYLVVLALFVLGVRQTILGLGKKLGGSVFARHKQAQHIVDTGTVPADWARKIQGSGSDRPRGSHVQGPSDPRRDRAVRMLAELQAYFRRAPVFDTESTRALLLRRLQEVEREWAVKEWREISPDTPEPHGSPPHFA
jgi:hypothetical protein